MNGVKILHVADCHIGASRSFLEPGNTYGRTEIKDTFRKITELCKKESVDFLLIAGDLFESPFPRQEDVTEICHMFSLIPETIVAISPGNHDYACAGSVYLKHKFPENVIIFSSFAEHYDFKDKNVRLFGAGFTDRFETLPLFSGFETADSSMINLCVIHGDLTSESSDSNYNPITINQIQNSGFDYIALGHIHKKTDILKAGNTYYSYCGCPDGTGFDEDGSKGIYIGTVGRGLCSLEYREFSSRMYLYDSFDITKYTSALEVSNAIFEYLKEKYGDMFAKNIYRISLQGLLSSEFSLNLSRIKSLLEEKITYCDLTDETEPDLDAVKKISKEESLRGIFAKNLLNRLDNAKDNEIKLIRDALKLGLKAFEGEVKLGDY